MLLHVAFRIFSCKEYIVDLANTDCTEALLSTFVRLAPSIYGDQFMSITLIIYST